MSAHLAMIGAGTGAGTKKALKQEINACTRFGMMYAPFTMHSGGAFPL
jgi:hypothetical protein